MMLITSIEAGLLPLIILGLCNINAGSCAENDASVRNKKHFSLFSVVTFKNEECSSEASWAGGQIQGTCYSSTECTDKSGTKSGNCASGFGVCCTFTYNVLTSTTISENRTYIENPLFPNTETAGAGTTTTYTINKMQSDICQLRLDFDTFVIAGPANTQEGGPAGGDATGNCLDTLTFALTGGAIVTVVCGVNTNQHLYMDMGMEATDNAAMALALASETIVAGISGITVANANRKWRVKTSQIPCWAPYRAPDGCNQYFTSAVGQITSVNFAIFNADRGDNLLTSGESLLAQHTKYCIRREANHCCVLFQVCNSFAGIDLTIALSAGDVANGQAGQISEGWSFHTFTKPSQVSTDTLTLIHNDIGLTDGACSTDYVGIPDSQTGYKTYGSNQPTNSRYCGHRFGNIPATNGQSLAGWQTHAPVWDCTEPFEVTYHTDQMTDIGTQTYATAIAQTAQPYRGLCLDFSQDAC